MALQCREWAGGSRMAIGDRPLSLEVFRYKGGVGVFQAIAFEVRNEQQDRGQSSALTDRCKL
ncbi:MAG: hypothetical protein ACRC8Y_21135 [Chroococcales cyanobacterium]